MKQKTKTAKDIKLKKELKRMDKQKQLAVVSPRDLLMADGPYNEKQLQLFYQSTPKSKIMQRKAKGGGTWNFVQADYVIEVLNSIYGYMWSFEIVTSLEEAAKISASGTCVVKGRLTVYPGGKALIREQFGRCEVKYKTAYDPVKKAKVRTNEFLDFGNDLKGAGSDALKKCASQLGLFRDVYHGDDFEQLKVVTDDEKEAMEKAEIDAAMGLLRKAKKMGDLRKTWVELPAKIRLNTEVAACKDAMKEEIKGVKDGNTSDRAK